MKLHHHSSTTVHAADRGSELGLAFRDVIQDNVRGYLEFFNSLGIHEHAVRTQAELSLEALTNWRPALAEELRATAETAKLAAWQLSAVNARTEILAAAQASAHECSTIVHAPAQAPGWGIQTWDWHPSLVHNGLVMTLRTPTHRTVKTFTEFGAQGKIGVNDAGLGVHFNILSHHSDRRGPGVPVHSIARAILEEADSLDQARALLSTVQVSASTALTVLESHSAGSRTASFELSPSGIGEVRPDAEGILVRTNHFLSPELAPGETVSLSESRTQERFAFLRTVAQRTAKATPETAARAEALYAHGTGSLLCFVPDPALPATKRWQTLVTVALDPHAGDMEIATHAPGPAAHAAFTRY